MPNVPSNHEVESLLKTHWAAASSNPRKAIEALLAKRSSGGRQRAGWLGHALYAANDGLGSIFGVVSGVSGATLGNQKYVLLAGLAGVVASALSAATGAYSAAVHALPCDSMQSRVSNAVVKQRLGAEV